MGEKYLADIALTTRSNFLVKKNQTLLITNPLALKDVGHPYQI